ncbi:MAG: pyridoxal phosphate-dependent aminotransferase [Candidatus Thorarchaeota archaeon]
MPKMNQRIQGLPRSGIDLVLRLAKIPDILSLCIGEPGFETPTYVKDAAVAAIREGRTHYSPDEGLLKLREVVLEKCKQYNHFAFDVEKNIVITSGTSPAIYNTFQCLLESNDEIIVPTPAYFGYSRMIQILGGKPVQVPSLRKNNFQPNVETINDAITNSTKAIIVHTPSNPTGAVWSAKNLQAIGEIAKDNDLFIIADEVYERLVYRGAKHVSIASLSDFKNRTITICGLSKSHAMAGFRIGWIIGPEQFMDCYKRIHEQTSICAPTLSQHAAVAALSSPEVSVEYMLTEYQKRSDLLIDAFENDIPYLEPVNTNGSLFMMVSLHDLLGEKMDQMAHHLRKDKEITKRLTDDELKALTDGSSPSETAMAYLLSKTGVLMMAGRYFGTVGDNYLRVSFAPEHDTISRAIHRLKERLE